jgi:hypothetical protein
LVLLLSAPVGAIVLRCWVKTLLGGTAEAAKQWKEQEAVSFGKFFERCLEGAAVAGEGAPDELAALGRELDDPGAAVASVVVACDQPAALEAVDGGGHGAAGEKDFLADLPHWERAFVEERFEDSEVGDAHVELGDAAVGQRLDGSEGLPEDEPEVDGAEVGLWVAAHIYLDIKMLDGEVWIQTPPRFYVRSSIQMI